MFILNIDSFKKVKNKLIFFKTAKISQQKDCLKANILFLLSNLENIFVWSKRVICLFKRKLLTCVWLLIKAV